MIEPYQSPGPGVITRDSHSRKQNLTTLSTGCISNERSAAIKITIGGDGNVGKSTLIRRLCTGKFDPARMMTIGVDFHVYDIPQDDQNARLIVWDLGGQDQFAFTRQAFYRGSKAIGLLFDVSDYNSFARLTHWKNEIRAILPSVPLVIGGNKVDLSRQVSRDEGVKLATEWGVPYFETSSLTGNGVQDFFRTLTELAGKNSKNRFN